MPQTPPQSCLRRTMVAVVEGDDRILDQFFEYIWEGGAGYAYIAHKIPENQFKFQQTFFRWPDERQQLVQHIIDHRTKYEIYFAPAIFRSPSGQKDQVLGARVYWCEFDGK